MRQYFCVNESNTNKGGALFSIIHVIDHTTTQLANHVTIKCYPDVLKLMFLYEFSSFMSQYSPQVLV